jgi:hypothetical protein
LIMEPESESVELKPRNVVGGPVGNQKARKHGVRGLQIARKVGKIDKRTSFGQAFERRKREYVAHLGGDVSAMELVLIEDTVWNDFYVMNYDVYLSGLKSVVRKGRPHPIVAERNHAAAHRRENLKLLGLKRVAKTLSLHEILAKDDDKPADKPADGNGAADEPK